MTHRSCVSGPHTALLQSSAALLAIRPINRIDFLDPAYAPATGTPVVGGPNTAYARDALKRLVGMNIVGGDQVEVAPAYEGPAQITALAGATIAADILYLIGEGISR